MNLTLWEPLQLRTTAVLGDFAGKEVLPKRFGDLRNTRFPLVKLDDSNWLAADHAMPITAAFVDDEETLGFDTKTEGDEAGNTWTIVRLAAPAPPEAKVSASGVGLRDPVSGDLLENPADIMEYVLRLAGRSETFPLLRAECSAANIVLAGSLDRVQSIRAWLDEIAYSAGAIWTPDAARLYPVEYVRGSIVELDRFGASNIAVTSELDDTADILRLFYDLNDATNTPQGFVELTASPQRYGGVVAEVTLRWMRQAGNAEAIGRRMLGRMAGIRYNVDFSSDQTYLRPCQWTRLTSHPEWPIPEVVDPTPMILAVESEPENKTAQIAAEVIASTPTITVTAHSLALPSTTGAAVAVAIAGNVVTFTIFGDGAKPVKDALCSLDGAPGKKTNEEGKVKFDFTPSTPPKKHQLAVQARGFTPFLLDVFL